MVFYEERQLLIMRVKVLLFDRYATPSYCEELVVQAIAKHCAAFYGLSDILSNMLHITKVLELTDKVFI